MSFKEVSLGECIEIIIDNRGKTPKKMGGDWVDEGIKTISAKNIHGGELTHLEDIRFVDFDVYKKWMKVDIKRGDCLLVSEGATLGENMYWDSDEKVVLGQRLFGIRTNNEILDSKYFSAYMNTIQYQKEIEGRATGTSVLGLRQTELLNTKVAIRPIAEQRFIGNLYYEINKKIEVNKKINQRLEEMAQSIFKHWFVDFEFPNGEGKSYKSSGGEMVESELGMIPKGWEVKELNEIFAFKKGKKPKEILETKENENYKKYLTIDVLNQNSELFALTEKVVECSEDDTLMVMDGASSGAIFTGMSGIVGSTLSKLEVKNDILKSFVFQLLKFREVDIKSHLTGSAIPHADKSYIYAQKVALPNDIDLLNHLTETFRLSMKKNRLNNIETSKLKIVRDTLLPKLMSGEVRIPLQK